MAASVDKLLLIIDGTGPYSDQQYDRDFQSSFCAQLKSKVKNADVKYWPGPGTIGLTTGSKACGVSDFAIRAYKKNPKLKIYLAGYSRGGACAIQAAKWCAANQIDSLAPGQSGFQLAKAPLYVHTPDPIPIEALLLLDPVDRDLSICGQKIPSNVRRCYAMYRDTSILQYDAPLKQSEFQSNVDKALVVGFFFTDPDRYARKFMRNCDVSPEDGNKTTSFISGEKSSLSYFEGVVPGASHGAIGGLPWVERRADEASTKKAAEYFNGWLKKEGLNAAVADNSYTAASKQKYKEVTDAEIRAQIEKKAASERAFNKALERHMERGGVRRPAY